MVYHFLRLAASGSELPKGDRSGPQSNSFLPPAGNLPNRDEAWGERAGDQLSLRAPSALSAYRSLGRTQTPISILLRPGTPGGDHGRGVRGYR